MDQVNVAALKAAWWRVWWEQDFSWQGLAELPIAGGGNHQDYWREEGGHLTKSPVSGREFTRFHLPLLWEDGTPTGKADWHPGELDEALADHLKRAKTSDFYWSTRATGLDRRAQMSGVIFPGALGSFGAHDEPVHIRADWTWFGEGLVRYGRPIGARSSFENSWFGGRAGFEAVEFLGDVWFRKATFTDGAWFDRATFKGLARFEDCRVVDLAGDAAFRFDSAVFESQASFERANLEESRNLSFRSARPSSTVRFDDVAFPNDPKIHAGAFADVTFPRLTSFQGRSFTAFAMLYGARFDGLTLFSRETLDEDRGFDTAIAALHRLKPGDRAEHFSQMQAVMTSLKQNAEQRRDRSLEQTFYRYELIAREQNPRTARFDRTASRLYGGLTGYGLSIQSPVIGVGWALLVFALAYWLAGLALAGGTTAAALLRSACEAHRFWEAVTLSIETTFKPFGHLGRPDAATPVIGMVGRVHPGGKLVVQLLAIAQSLFSVAMLFAAGLALRRRFQIA
ncbi:pentapeptide repeat-containing protein [Caulobacter flavus]|uniref:pentapeptide repeat-containing protein n=1 Tax=Caulobacter flavus TaxID=1679497 RepID=UPI0011AFBB40|nr:pentapeptide repeat-containing protein [Caulobacter flavus]